jgi:transposase, IS30 family
MSYKRMSLNERMEIFKGLYQQRMNSTEIAERLNRTVSTITREIDRGSDGDGYNPFYAEYVHLKKRINQSPKLKINGNLWRRIKDKLELRWSPEQIARFLKKSRIGSVSGKTIYNYINFHLKGELKKLALGELRQRGKKRRSLAKTDGRGKLKNLRLIDERPKEVESRDIPGHWEGDLIIGKDHKSALAITVERSSRFVQIDLLHQYDANSVRKVFEKRFRKLEPMLRKTLTLDQGKENADYDKLKEHLNIDVYFCHPASPWQKGTCENTNGLIRDFLDGENDFRNFDQRYFSRIATLLNERPRKTLDFNTPMETINKLH